VEVATEDPAGFRLYFHHAAREPEFRAHADALYQRMRTVAEPYFAAVLPDRARLHWAAMLVPALIIEMILAWLDAGQPPAAHLAEAIRGTAAAAVTAIGNS
jgi:hypothetical protein